MKHRIHVFDEYDGCCLEIEYDSQNAHLVGMNKMDVEVYL